MFVSEDLAKSVIFMDEGSPAVPPGFVAAHAIA